MNQQGFIIEVVDKKTAKMIMQRHSACASCGKCTKLSSECQDLVVEVDNSIGAKKGDHVEVSMESVKVIKATMLAYLFPLIFHSLILYLLRFLFQDYIHVFLILLL